MKNTTTNTLFYVTISFSTIFWIDDSGNLIASRTEDVLIYYDIGYATPDSGVSGNIIAVGVDFSKGSWVQNTTCYPPEGGAIIWKKSHEGASNVCICADGSWFNCTATGDDLLGPYSIQEIQKYNWNGSTKIWHTAVSQDGYWNLFSYYPETGGLVYAQSKPGAYGIGCMNSSGNELWCWLPPGLDYYFGPPKWVKNGPYAGKIFVTLYDRSVSNNDYVLRYISPTDYSTIKEQECLNTGLTGGSGEFVIFDKNGKMIHGDPVPGPAAKPVYTINTDLTYEVISGITTNAGLSPRGTAASNTATILSDGTLVFPGYVNAGSMAVLYHLKEASPAPTAAFSGTPVSGNTPLTVQFTDASIDTPTGWSWDFGDGETSTDQNPQHTYTIPGEYDVGLTATNGSGSDTELKLNYILVTSATGYPIISFNHGRRGLGISTDGGVVPWGM